MYYATCAPGNKTRKTNYNRAFLKTTRPSANIIKNEDGFIIQLAIPGFSKKDISIALDDEKLIIKSNLETKSEEMNYKLREFDFNTFSRSFSLSKDLDQEKISAKMDKGVLSIEIPYLPVIPAKQISIK